MLLTGHFFLSSRALLFYFNFCSNYKAHSGSCSLFQKSFSFSFETTGTLRRKREIMSSLYHQSLYPVARLFNPVEQSLFVKLNEIPGWSVRKKRMFRAIRIEIKGRQAAAVTEVPCDSETGMKNRQNIPTKKRMVDPFRQGVIVEGGVGYRQTVVVRSYEVGADRTATLESVFNLLQETALNHVWVSGLLGDGFGATHCMVKNNLIWVVSRMQVEVEDYPVWGEVMEVDTWVAASGKNGMRRDWLIRGRATGQVFIRATSTWVMMNQKTRRLSKMPDEIRAEISPWFTEKKAIQNEIGEKINKLDSRAKYVTNNLKPKRSDLDMNNHVNNVKYVNWMLEAIPCEFLEHHQLSGIILEYRRECGSSDTVQSLCQPEEENSNKKARNSSDGDSSALVQDESYGNSMQYTHLLQTVGDKGNEEIVRGRTTWKRKL